MNELTKRERELVAMGAAMGSNCVSCIKFHVLEARSAGLTDAQIRQAVELADAVRTVSARNALAATSQCLSASCANPETSVPGNSSERGSQHAGRCC